MNSRVDYRMLEEEKQKSEQMEKVLYELQMKLEGRSSRREFLGERDDGNEEDTEIEETLEGNSKILFIGEI